MNILENLYENIDKNEFFSPRKYHIKEGKILLRGSPFSGKTSLILDHATLYKNSELLYLDLQDKRLSLKAIQKDLHEFIKAKDIKLLIIENYDFSLDLPNVPNTVLSTRSCHTKIENFETLDMFALDFEEYISFDKRHFNIAHLFNLYTHTGVIPHFIAQGVHHPKPLHVQKLFASLHKCPHEKSIFERLCALQGTKLSLYTLFKDMKQDMKLSKDKFYLSVESLLQSRQLFLVEKYAAPKSAKKVFLFDFALRNAFSFKKDFLKTFENMIFLELLKETEEIFYTQNIDLFIPSQQRAVFCIPFLTEDFIKVRLSKIAQHLHSLHVNRVEIITVGNEGNFSLDGLVCRIIPFWEWALGN